MQQPTISGLKIRTIKDAHIIFHAVSLDKLKMVRRRLDNEERRRISSGCIYVWEEKGAQSHAGIERWTDSVRWGPSRCRDEFLFYQEKDSGGELADADSSDSDPPFSALRSPHRGGRERLVKQTYSVFVDSPRGRRKWHLIAYFTSDTLSYLQTVDEIPFLSQILVPEGLYKSARSAKGRVTRAPADIFVRGDAPAVAVFPRSMSLLWHPDQEDRPDSSEQKAGKRLAPLTYLQATPPHRRHPVDEEALMSFTPGLL